jgi:hypothetical protein
MTDLEPDDIRACLAYAASLTGNPAVITVVPPHTKQPQTHKARRKNARKFMASPVHWADNPI